MPDPFGRPPPRLAARASRSLSSKVLRRLSEILLEHRDRHMDRVGRLRLKQVKVPVARPPKTSHPWRCPRPGETTRAVSLAGGAARKLAHASIKLRRFSIKSERA